MHSRQRGFTIIELFTVIAILGILTTIAVFTAIQYTYRARVSEGLYMAAGAKTKVTLAIYEQAEPPLNNEKVGMSAPTEYQGNNVASITISGPGIITVLYKDIVGSPIDGKELQFVPTFAGGVVSYVCDGSGGANPLAPEHLPGSCR